MKNKSLNKMYKGLTESVVKEAFGWNDKFCDQNQNKTRTKSYKKQVK